MFAMQMKDRLNVLGLKATPQRLALLMLLHEEGHMTIEALYERLKDGSSSLSLSTVYNNLSALREKGLVKEVAVAGSKQFFELDRHEHAHFICKECGMIVDLPISKSGLKNLIDLPKGAAVDDINLVFSGVCLECRAEDDKERELIESARVS